MKESLSLKKTMFEKDNKSKIRHGKLKEII